ncbi:MAG: glycosyltransferase family 4 protein [Nitrospiraceae bacterium]|nr:glycosyltransferase family 4 protein [Nitrospiraceae bacterium]
MLELAQNLVQLGVEVKIYSVFLNRKKCYEHLLEGLDITSLFEERELDNKNKKFNLKGFNEIQKKADYLTNLFKYQIYFKKMLDRMERVDLLNFHDYNIYLISPLFKEKFKKPAIWTMNDAPTTRAITAPTADVPFAKRLLKKMMLADFIGEKWDNKILSSIQSTDNIVVLDNINRRKLRDYYDKDSIIVRGGLNIEDYMFAPRNKNRDVINIFCNGIFFPHRRFEDVIDALNIVRDKGLRFTMNHVGTDERDPAYALKIRSMVKKYGLSDDIKFHGFVQENKLIKFYRESDIFIFPNNPQTWGLAVFEAMACGTPVIVSKGCGASEVLTDHEDSILVDPNSPEQIANGIIELSKQDELWDKLHINGRRFVEANISWRLYARNMLNIFNDALQKGRKTC